MNLLVVLRQSKILHASISIFFAGELHARNVCLKRMSACGVRQHKPALLCSAMCRHTSMASAETGSTATMPRTTAAGSVQSTNHANHAWHITAVAGVEILKTQGIVFKAISLVII